MICEIAIVEDEQKYADDLEKQIKRYCKENDVLANIKKFSDGDLITENFKSTFDIIFLDIQMKRLDGVKTAEFIRKFDEEVSIIFVTNMPQFAIKGYEVGAQSYLLKPVEYESVKKQMDLSIRRISANRVEENFLFNTDVGTVRINVKDVVYIQSLKHMMTVYVDNGKEYNMYSSLTELEKRLAPYGFVRCSKYCIVNLKFVTGIKNAKITLLNGNSLDLGGAYKSMCKEAFLSYVRNLVM